MKSKISGMRMSAYLAALVGCAYLSNAATTGTVSPGGTVGGVLQITVTPQGTPSGLDLTAVGADVSIATVTERSNHKTGYTVTLTSANAVATAVNTAYFKGADANPETLNYTIKGTSRNSNTKEKGLRI
jgi:hypothetical protein